MTLREKESRRLQTHVGAKNEEVLGVLQEKIVTPEQPRERDSGGSQDIMWYGPRDGVTIDFGIDLFGSLPPCIVPYCRDQDFSDVKTVFAWCFLVKFAL